MGYTPTTPAKKLAIIDGMTSEEAVEIVRNGCFSTFTAYALITGTYAMCNRKGDKVYHVGIVIRDEGKDHWFTLNPGPLSCLADDGQRIGGCMTVGETESDGGRFIQRFVPVVPLNRPGKQPALFALWSRLVGGSAVNHRIAASIAAPGKV